MKHFNKIASICCRLAHPGGPLATNKAAALAKFLKRKLNEPGGAASLDPALVEKAVDSAKATAHAGTALVSHFSFASLQQVSLARFCNLPEICDILAISALLVSWCTVI